MLVFRPVDVKPLSDEVILMKWNPSMDLIAFVYGQGDVSLNRLLSCQRVWRIPCPANNLEDSSSARVTSEDRQIWVANALDWRPDGRVLAICYHLIVNNSTPNALTESVCFLHDVENGEVIWSIPMRNVGFITAIGWFQYSPSDSLTQTDEIRFNGDSSSSDPLLVSIEDSKIDIAKYLPSMDPLPSSGTARRNRPHNMPSAQSSTSNKGTFTTNDCLSESLASEQKDLNLLTLATSKRMIHFYALGLYDVGSLPLKCSSDNALVTQINLSSCLRYLTVVFVQPSSTFSLDSPFCKSRGPYPYCYFRLDVISQGAHQDQAGPSKSKDSNNLNSSPEMDMTYSIKVIEIETFYKRSQEVLTISKMYAKILSGLQYLDEVVRAITGSWEDVLAGLDSKLAFYSSRQKSRPDLPANTNYTILTADEFLQLLVFGTFSDNLEKFLHDLSDKGLKKLNHAIEQTCSRVQKLVVRNAQKCCYHLHNDLNLLRGMSLWKSRFQDVGLEEPVIIDSMKSVGALLLKSTELQQAIDHSLRSAKSFFRWLNAVMSRVSYDQTTSGNETTAITQQDIQLITDFIEENFDAAPDSDDAPSKIGDCIPERPTCSNFTLEQVGQYLKDEQLTRQKFSFLNPGSNFWIDFIKEKPGLCDHPAMNPLAGAPLLFYPHDPETSLLQEHKRTDLFVRKAFESISDNMEVILSRSEVLLCMEDISTFSTKLGYRDELFRTSFDAKSEKLLCLFMNYRRPSNVMFLLSINLVNKEFELFKISFGHSKLGAPTDSNTENSMETDQDQGSLMIQDSDFFTGSVPSFLVCDERTKTTYIILAHATMLAGLLEKRTPRKLEDIKYMQLDDLKNYQNLHIALNDPPRGLVCRRVKSVLGKQMAVDGYRKVACFLSHNNLRVHLFEMMALELDEDPDEDDIGIGDYQDSSMDMS